MQDSENYLSNEPHLKNYRFIQYQVGTLVLVQEDLEEYQYQYLQYKMELPDIEV